MKYYLWYRVDNYIPESLETFENEELMLEFINGYTDPCFKIITVVRGFEVKLKPVEVVKKYVVG